MNTVTYKYIHPPLGSGFRGKEIQECGLADKYCTHSPGPLPALNASERACLPWWYTSQKEQRGYTTPELQVDHDVGKVYEHVSGWL